MRKELQARSEGAEPKLPKAPASPRAKKTKAPYVPPPEAVAAYEEQQRRIAAEPPLGPEEIALLAKLQGKEGADATSAEAS